MMKKTVTIACFAALLGSSVAWGNMAVAHSVRTPHAHQDSHHKSRHGGHKNSHSKHHKKKHFKKHHRRHHGQHTYHRGSGKHGKHGKYGKYGKHHRHGGRHHTKTIIWYPAPHYPVFRGHHKHHHHHRPVRYGHVHWSKDAYRWAAFTAITLRIIDHLDHRHQRQHESAQIRATYAPIGQPIRWSSNGAKGYVTATREGMDGQGRLCREFAHEVRYQGQQRQTSGVACRGGDGVWNVNAPG